MDLAQLVLVFLSCVMFILVVSTLVRAGGRQSPKDARVVEDPGGEGWLTIDEVAALLETESDEILILVERGAIPFFVEPRSPRVAQTAYWFRRDEIEDWTVG